MTKVVYIISNINKSLAFEWIASRLPSEKIRLSFILLNPGSSELESFLKTQGIACASLSYQGFKDLPKTIIKLIQMLRANKPEVIHCHLLHATLTGLIAGYLAGVKRRIYTRHHSTYNWEYNKKGVRIDRFLNWLATDIVAISENVKRVLLEKENVKAFKIHLIHHGFDLNAFSDVDNARVFTMADKYNPDGKTPVIGVISRWLHLKGLQYIIPAFQSLLKDYPNALLILANASGTYKLEIEKLLTVLPVDSYKTIPFENDLFALYQLFDVYVHTPINPTIEAFGQTYVEALAAGIPSIFTLSGVAPEFIEHEKNALVVPFEDRVAIYEAMLKLLNDRSLSTKLSKNGRSAVHRFDLKQMIDKLKKLYEL